MQLETFGQIPTDSIIFGKLKQLHSNMGTIGNTWANWKSFIQICIRGMLWIFGRITTAQIQFGPTETTSFKFG